MGPHFALLPPAGWVCLSVFGLVLPYLALVSAVQPRPPVAVPPRKRLYLLGYVQKGLLLWLALWTSGRMSWHPFPPYAVRAEHLLAGLALLAAAVAWAWPRWRDRAVGVESFASWYLPKDGLERGMWVLASAVAGFGEEVEYRYVLFHLGLVLTGSFPGAALLSAVPFALAHANQGWRVVAGLLGIALLLQALVWWTGTLWIAIGVHFLYNALAGLAHGPLARRSSPAPDAW